MNAPYNNVRALKGRVLYDFKLTRAVVMVRKSPRIGQIRGWALKILHSGRNAISHSTEHDDSLRVETSSVINGFGKCCLKNSEKGSI
jgi:hypothetical protein